MPNKYFIERLNKELDSMGVPKPSQERKEALSKLIKIPMFKADAWLEGIVNINDPQLELLAQELEVSIDKLLGKSA